MHEIWEQGQNWRKRLQRIIDLVDTPRRYGTEGQVLVMTAEGRSLEWGDGLLGGAYDHIIRMSENSWTLYPSTGAGLTAALAAASSGEAVWVPKGTYSADYTVGEGVALVGVDNRTVIIDGMITMEAGAAVYNCRWIDTFADDNDHYGIKVLTEGYYYIVDCRIYFTQNGGGGTYGIYVDAAAMVYIDHCSIECMGHNGHAIYADESLSGAANPVVTDTNTSAPITEELAYTDEDLLLDPDPGQYATVSADWKFQVDAPSDSYTYFSLEWKTLVEVYEAWGDDLTNSQGYIRIYTYPAGQGLAAWYNPVTNTWDDNGWPDQIGSNLWDDAGALEHKDVLLFRVRRTATYNSYIRVLIRAQCLRELTDSYAYIREVWSSERFPSGLHIQYTYTYGSYKDIYVEKGDAYLQACTYRPSYSDGDGLLIPEPGDRSTWDLARGAGMHASDIAAASPVYHWTQADIEGVIDTAISGTAGRVAQFATGGHSLVDSTLVKSGAGVLTLSASADYTATIPATGTVALLGIANTFTVGPQTIQTGAAGNVGLVVQGAASQSANIQEWKNSGGTAFTFIDNSGRLRCDGGVDNSCFFAGYLAGNASSGAYNLGIGYSVLRVATGGNNTAFGTLSFYSLTTGSYNVAIGSQVMQHGEAHKYCIGIGTAALMGFSGVSKNEGVIAIGENAGRLCSSAYYNVFIGSKSGYNNGAGKYNVCIGHQSSYTGSGNYNINIGYNAGYYETGSSKLFIDNSQRANEADAREKAFIYGDIAAGRLQHNALTTTTNAILELFRLQVVVSTDGTGGAAGFGPAYTLFAESATDGNYRQQAQLASVWATATDATRKARSVWSVWDTAEREGIRIEADGSAAMLGFYGGAAVVRGAALTAQLTTITHTVPGTPDYAVQDLVDSSAGAAFGFATKDEGNSVLAVVANLQTRVAELEARLGSATGVNLFA